MRQLARRIADVELGPAKPSVLKLDYYPDRHLLADRVRLPMAALWHSSSKNLDLADWPLSASRYGSFGSGHAGRLFKFAARKRSLKFRFPEAAVRHRVLPTQSCHGGFPIAAFHQNSGFPNRTATKRPVATSPYRPQPDSGSGHPISIPKCSSSLLNVHYSVSKLTSGVPSPFLCHLFSKVGCRSVV